MFDATKLLGGFLQGRQSGSGGSPFQSGHSQSGGLGGMVQQALSSFVGGRSANALGGLLGQFTGSGQHGQPGQGGRGAPGGGGMVDQMRDMATRAVNDPGAELRGNNPAAVGGLGALAGALMGGGRGAVGGGLLAVLGSLAYSAYQKQGEAAPAGAASTTVSPWGQGARPVIGTTAPGDDGEVQRKAALVLRAMIQATKADGQLDDAESRRLSQHIAEAGDDPEAQAFLRDEMARPVDIEGLASQVRSPEEGAEIYAASIMAISIDTQAERDYLARLAQALRLPEQVVSHVHGSLDAKN